MGALVYITGWCGAQGTTGALFAVSMFPGLKIPAMSLPAAEFTSAAGSKHVRASVGSYVLEDAMGML